MRWWTCCRPGLARGHSSSCCERSARKAFNRPQRSHSHAGSEVSDQSPASRGVRASLALRTSAASAVSRAMPERSRTSLGPARGDPQHREQAVDQIVLRPRTPPAPARRAVGFRREIGAVRAPRFLRACRPGRLAVGHQGRSWVPRPASVRAKSSRAVRVTGAPLGPGRSATLRPGR